MECKEPGSNNARGGESQKLSAKSVWLWIFFFFPFPPKSSLWTHPSMIPSFPYCFHQMTLIVRMVMLCACVFWRKGQDLCHTTAIFGISYLSIQNAPKGHYVVLKNKVKLNFNIKNKDFFFFSSLTEEQAFLRGK